MTALLLALALAAGDGTRWEVQAAFGEPVDTYSPAGDLGLPYRADVIAVTWELRRRPIPTAIGVWEEPGMLLTVLFDGEGRLIEARRQRLGDPGATVYEVTDALRRILRARRT